MAINEPDDAIVGVQATGLSCYPEAKATVGEPHLLLADRRLDWHRAHHEGGHITVAWLSKWKSPAVQPVN